MRINETNNRSGYKTPPLPLPSLYFSVELNCSVQEVFVYCIDTIDLSVPLKV